MSHREDLLDGAVRCLREKGYAKTTARDIVKASGTNLASIGYHYGSTEALLNAAVLKAMSEVGNELGRAMADTAKADETIVERFERCWTYVIASFQDDPGVWTATFDVFGVALRNPEISAAVADGLEAGRQLWSRVIYGSDDRAVGSLLQALLSGILVQWMIDPERAPAAADLARSLAAITSQIAAEQCR
jgi:AcrR family transcriptional regulator